MQTRSFLPLVSLSALAAALLGASVSSARAAEIVASNTAGAFLLPFSTYTGQSFTTTTATAENNIRLNYFLDVDYAGTPAGLSSLSSATPGFLGQAVAAGGFYTFDSSLTLAPGTQYFFYEDAVINQGGRSGGPGVLGVPGGIVYTGGVAFFTFPASPNSNFVVDPNGFSANFRVTGSPAGASVPDSGASALLLGLGVAALLISQRALGRHETPLA